MTSEDIGMHYPSMPQNTAMNMDKSHSSKENESLGFILARYSYLSSRTKGFNGLVNKLKNLFLIFKENKLFNEVSQKRANTYTEQSKNQVNSYVLPLVKKHLHMGKLKFDDNSFQENTKKIIENVNKKINKDREKTFKKLISDIKNNRLKFNSSVDKNQLIAELKQIALESELKNLNLILNKIHESGGVNNPKSPNYAKLIEFQNVTKEDLEKEINFYRNETARINLTTKGVAYKNKSLSGDLKAALTAKEFDPNKLIYQHLKVEFDELLKEIYMSPFSVNQLPLDKMDPTLKVVFKSLAAKEAGNSFRIFVNQLPQIDLGQARANHYLDAFVLHRFVQENLKETINDLVDALVNNEEDSDQVANFLHTPYTYENDDGIQLLSLAVAEARNAPGLEPKLASLLPAFMVATVVEHAAEKFALDPDTLTKELHAQDGYKESAYQLTALVLPALESFHTEKTKEDPFQGLNKDQVKGLHLLTQMMRGDLEVPNDELAADGSKYLTQEETKLLKDFLNSIPGNKQLNSALTKILDAEKVPYGMSFVAINFLRTLSFKTINLQESLAALSKLTNALKRSGIQ